MPSQAKDTLATSFGLKLFRQVLIRNRFDCWPGNIILIVGFQRVKKFHIAQFFLRRAPVVLGHLTIGAGFTLGLDALHDTYSLQD